MKISLFDNARDTFPTLVETTWQDLVTNFSSHETGYTDKRDANAYSPAEWPEGTKHKVKKLVSRVHFGVIDLDKRPEDVVRGVMELLESKGIAYILYTTFSHAKYQAKGLWAVRVILPFSRPVEASEWKQFWPRMNAATGGMCDPSCKDSSRIYFEPSCPAAEVDQSYIVSHEGGPLDVDTVMGTIIPAELDSPDGPEPVEMEAVDALAKRLSKSLSGPRRVLGARLSKMLRGDIFADEGERDSIIFRMCCVLVEEWPHADPNKLASFFARSLEAMERKQQDCPTIEVVLEKIIRHQDQVQEEKAAKDTEEGDIKKRLIRAAFKYSGRESPYTEDEIKQYAKDAGVSLFDFNKLWVVQRNLSYYFFKNGTYSGPYMQPEMVEAAERELAPAANVGVQLYKATPLGVTRKSPSELVQDYGQVAADVQASFVAQKSYYDNKTYTLVEAPCPQRALEPKYSAKVDGWLKHLGGDHYGVLQDWLACITRLEEPCAALYLEGAPGAGKTLLADGLARIWTTSGPTPLEDAFSAFNSNLTRCPLVLADEVVPKNFRGEGRTGELRQFIQARQRTLHRKFMPDASLIGAIRLILTANNKDLLTSNEHLTSNDIAAIIDRILHIPASSSATKYLNSLSYQDRSEFVQGDGIARHALHLSATRSVAPGKRFLVTGDASTLHRALTTSTGLRSAICHWLTSYLLEPNKVDSTDALLVRLHQGSILATARGLAKFWPLYETNCKPPAAGLLAKSLAGLASGKRQLTAGDGHRTNYWVIDSENIIAWAEDNGFADTETIRDLLAGKKPSSATTN